MKSRLRVSLVPLIGLVIAPVVWLVASAPVSAEGIGAKAGPAVIAVPHAAPSTYGPVDEVSKTITMGEFDKPNNTVTWSTIASGSTGISIYQTSAPSVDWWQGVNIPNGSIIDTIELEACDTSATGEILFGMTAGASPAGAAANVTPIGTTGGAPTPGCAFFSVTPTSPPLVVDNRNNNYWLFLNYSGDFGGGIFVNAIRVFYHLQVSPAPGTATFDDVPTSDFAFQFVEAFNAAGITVGCQVSPPLFCPDNNVTRREMAVFFAKALGLHFPN